WGSAADFLCYPDRRSSPAYVVALGLVALSLLGGILNLLHLASSVWLAVCAYTGILLSVLFILFFSRGVAGRKKSQARLMLQDWIYLAVLLATGIFLALTLLPAAVFNFHDDFLTYFPRILRLRQTGTLGGHPFEIFGLSDFGL